MQSTRKSVRNGKRFGVQPKPSASLLSVVLLRTLQFVSECPALGDLDKVGIVERRRIFDEVEASAPKKELPGAVKNGSLDVQTFTIKARDAYDIPVRSYVPTSGRPAESRPLLVYLHAGGFLFGDLESGDLNCRVLAVRLDISVLNVGYRLAPRWPFPHGFNDSYDATEWVSCSAGCFYPEQTKAMLKTIFHAGCHQC
jgi:acetyl esterase/lipase